MADALVVAKNAGLDVFNALDIMENAEFIEQLKFMRGSGSLHYYLFNWNSPFIEKERVGLVMH